MMTHEESGKALIAMLNAINSNIIREEFEKEHRKRQMLEQLTNAATENYNETLLHGKRPQTFCSSCREGPQALPKERTACVGLVQYSAGETPHAF